MLDGPRRDAAEAPARQLVVLLHGYGADGGDLVPLTDEWSGALPMRRSPRRTRRSRTRRWPSAGILNLNRP